MDRAAFDLPLHQALNDRLVAFRNLSALELNAVTEAFEFARVDAGLEAGNAFKDLALDPVRGLCAWNVDFEDAGALIRLIGGNRCVGVPMPLSQSGEEHRVQVLAEREDYFGLRVRDPYPGIPGDFDAR